MRSSGVFVVQSRRLFRRERRLIRVLIADDHSALRKGLRAILTSRPDISVCGEAADGQQAINLALELHPDLVILDLTMPILSGFQAAKVLRQMLPDVPIVFYSMHEGDTFIREAKHLGVRGYVSKSDLSSRLLDAVEAVVIDQATYFPDSSKGTPVLA